MIIGDKLRVFEAFAGYGSQHLALKRLQRDFTTFDFEVVGISEIDAYALQAYRAMHGDVTNFGDIAKIDWGGQVPDFDLFTYSFPCTDISNAGNQEGFAEGSGTRSSLLWECRRAIEVKRPKYLLMENVKALTQTKFQPLLAKWLKELDDFGYVTYLQVLNAKDYGVPQNRERVFAVSILKSLEQPFSFPKGWKLDKSIEDILEDEDTIDEKYYVSDKTLAYYMRVNADKEHNHAFKVLGKEDCCGAIRTKPDRVDANWYSADELNREDS